MIITRRKAMLFTAVLLISSVMAVTVIAQPLGMGVGRERGQGRSFIEPILIGHGFAIKDNEYHILDVNAVKMSDVSPGFIRSLFSHKKTPNEIAKEINDVQMATNTRAHLRFAGQAYALNITQYDNQSLTGDILTLAPRGTDQTSFIPTKVGNISLSISKYEGDVLSTGSLTMNNMDYKVLLTSPMRFEKW